VDRYRGIARAIAAVAEDPREQPIRGLSRRHTAAALLGYAVGESGLARDADLGPCYRVGGYATRCDSGRSATVFQLMTASGFRFGDLEVTQPMLFGDRTLAARVALTRLRRAVGQCWSLAPEHRFSALGGGACSSVGFAAEQSAVRYRLIMRARGIVDAGTEPPEVCQ
jgi:hypothetical protein